ncbi:MAG: O-antigen ligase family protein [Saprospiraceae bacterium]
MLANSQYTTKGEQRAFYGFVAVLLLLVLIALIKEMYIIAAAPVGLVVLYAIIRDYRALYYGFWVALPFSVEYNFGSLGMDIPTEPIMLGLTFIGILLLLSKLGKISFEYIYHPISVLLLLHLFWILFTSIYSQIPIVSYKFFLAKLWFVTPFFFLTFHFLKSHKDISKLVSLLTIFMSIAVMVVITRHAIDGFTFIGSHKVVRPIFRNHVNYAAMIVVLLPYVWALYKSTKKSFSKTLLSFVILLFIVGAYFSYTRAAQICIFVAIGAYFVIKFRLAKIALLSASIMTILLVGYLLNNNKYLDFAPQFEKTIAHTKFNNLIEATYKMEDISTMERVYRWVAAVQMIQRKPIIGFGPGGFYNNYTKYTVRSFETYVSDNPEKSGVHSYYLMTMVEQGIIGLLIFIAFCFSIILYGERLYHKLTAPKDKNYVMAAILSIIVICMMNLINDLIEVDKVGPLFLLSASIIVMYDIRIKRKLNS